MPESKPKDVPGSLDKEKLRAAWTVLQRLGLELSFVEFRSLWMRAMIAGRAELRAMNAPIPSDDVGLYALLVELVDRAA